MGTRRRSFWVNEDRSRDSTIGGAADAKVEILNGRECVELLSLFVVEVVVTG